MNDSKNILYKPKNSLDLIRSSKMTSSPKKYYRTPIVGHFMNTCHLLWIWWMASLSLDTPCLPPFGCQGQNTNYMDIYQYNFISHNHWHELLVWLKYHAWLQPSMCVFFWVGQTCRESWMTHRQQHWDLHPTSRMYWNFFRRMGGDVRWSYLEYSEGPDQSPTESWQGTGPVNTQGQPSWCVWSSGGR